MIIERQFYRDMYVYLLQNPCYRLAFFAVIGMRLTESKPFSIVLVGALCCDISDEGVFRADICGLWIRTVFTDKVYESINTIL